MAYVVAEADLPWMDVPEQYTFLFEAIDPSTGSAVSGVSVSSVAIKGENLGDIGALTRIIPTLTPDELEDFASGG